MCAVSIFFIGGVFFGGAQTEFKERHSLKCFYLFLESNFICKINSFGMRILEEEEGKKHLRGLFIGS